MAFILTYPRFDYLDADGIITAWLKNEGEEVSKGEPLFETESQKATQQVEATGSGFLGIFAPSGSAVSAGEEIGVLASSREELEQVLVERRRRAASTSARPATPGDSTFPADTLEQLPARIRVAHRAKRLAEKHGVDLAEVHGTGPFGRIMPEDVLRVVEQVRTALRPAEPKKIARVIPLRGIRRTTAERMRSSLQTGAQVTNTTDVDGTNLIEVRNSLAAESEILAGVRISYNDLFVAICAVALREFPMINSSIVGDEIRVWEDVNVGVAVNTEDGLLVPVIRQADRKSLIDIHYRLAELIAKCHDHTATPQELSGGTFTISNASRMGIDTSTAIINPPESAIVCVGRFVERPVVVDGAILIRTMIGLSLTYDHRVVDGVYACDFLSRICDLISKPDSLQLH